MSLNLYPFSVILFLLRISLSAPQLPSLLQLLKENHINLRQLSRSISPSLVFTSSKLNRLNLEYLPKQSLHPLVTSRTQEIAILWLQLVDLGSQIRAQTRAVHLSLVLQLQFRWLRTGALVAWEQGRSCWES